VIEQSYDLLDQSWIPVAWVDRTLDKPNKVGIRRALTHAQEIRSLSHTSPFVEFGLYRLLITIVLDACIVAGQRPTIEKMRAMHRNGDFPQPMLSNYLDSHSGAFCLWADAIPFLQHKRVNDRGKMPSPKPVVTMFPAIPSGTNVAHWHHYSEDEGRVSEEVAAQFLTTVSPFNFKVKPGEARTLAGDPPMYALVLGKDLFETIVLNLPRPNGRISSSEEKDNGPVWRTPLKPGKLPKVPTIVQGFTWPVRIIALQKGDGTVAMAINEAGYKKPTEKAKGKGGNLYDARYGWRDPNAGTETTTAGIVHIKAKPGIPVWRDAVPLFLVASEGEALRGEKRRSRPEVITNAIRILDTPQFRVAVYGMRKKSGGGGDVKVEEWFRSILTLPSEVARDSRLSARAIEAFRTTQKVADALRDALRMLRPPVKASKNKKPPPARGEADILSDFWQRLEPVLGRSYLEDLANNKPGADGGLRAMLHREARDAFTRASAPHRRTADGLFRIANARNWFARRLARLWPKPQPQETP
jgi:CRISPR type I-E-associated protein CasA/Cse1